MQPVLVKERAITIERERERERFITIKGFFLFFGPNSHEKCGKVVWVCVLKTFPFLFTGDVFQEKVNVSFPGLLNPFFALTIALFTVYQMLLCALTIKFLSLIVALEWMP